MTAAEVIEAMRAALGEALATRKVERYDFPQHVLAQMQAAYALKPDGPTL